MTNKLTNKNPKAKKQNWFKVIITTLVVVLVMISSAYCAFVTVVLANGSYNLYLAGPTIFTIFGIIVFAIATSAKHINN
jgi:flagellar basal body-associated protein FliL